MQRDSDAAIRVGIDAGASLLKGVAQEAQRFERRLFERDERDALLAWVRAKAPAEVGLTGGDGAALAGLLDAPSRCFGEFEAWAVGAKQLLAQAQRRIPEPYLLVSMGTGTSVIRVMAGDARRVGGCALGGGTLLGLGRLLLGALPFDEITKLASSGDRTRGVDLEIADIYPAVQRGFTAANFGGRAAIAGSLKLRREDLAHALAVLVGENVALVCCALARAEGLSQLVFGGATLRGNPASWRSIESMTRNHGMAALRLEGGEFAGATGALTLASTAASG